MLDSKDAIRLKELYGSTEVKRFGQFFYRVKTDQGYQLVHVSESGTITDQILPETFYNKIEVIYLYDYKGYCIPEDEFYYKVITDKGEGLLFASDLGSDLLLEPIYKGITKVRYAQFKLETETGSTYVSTQGGVVKPV